MAEKKKYGLFEAPRWREIPAVEVIGHREVTEEEKKRAEEFLKELEKKRNNEN